MHMQMRTPYTKHSLALYTDMHVIYLPWHKYYLNVGDAAINKQP